MLARPDVIRDQDVKQSKISKRFPTSGGGHVGNRNFEIPVHIDFEQFMG